MDRTFTIYTGKSRKATRWARREMTWPELRQAVTEFKVTPETISEYLCMDRERQTQIKDVGGFVGGELEGGVRKKANLRSRSIITLDFDGFTAGQFAELRGMFPGVCWAVYSTHKHTTREWRVRVVMPLARDVTPDEYVAVSRRVAETIGMQGIDRTTFEPCRLMFWPSRSVDAPWIDEGHDADAFLDPDRILDTYDDWRDPAQWPRTPEEADIFSTCAMPTGDPRVMEIWRQYTAAAKGGGDGSTLEDPASKPGVVGAFCRSYGIDEAIAAFLPDTYTRYRAGRYTYAAGRTVGGAVVYDDKWLFSHHATDPAGGRVLNAWDLVRVHRFGYLDDGSRATKTAQLPSQRAMTELAMKDRGTARLVAEETAERGRMAFEGIRVPDVTDENDGDDAGTPEDRWADTEASMRNRKGEFVCTRANLARVLMEHPVFAGKLRYNTFSGRMEVRVGAMPWPRPKEITADKNGKTALPVGVEEFDDTDAACLRSWMETTYNVNASGKVDDALTATRGFTAYHPIVEYLDSLTWDGTPRLADLLRHTLGAEDTELNRYLSRLIFVAAVARVRCPGIKSDICVTLYGEQGRGKSSLVSLMGGRWGMDSSLNIGNKDAYSALRGKWLVELAEMASLKRADLDAVKAFISAQSDTYRPAYGREEVTVARQCVFVATTNNELCLRGDDENRRFPIVTCRTEDIREPVWEYVPRWRDQLWAEADRLWSDGFRIYLPPDLDREARLIGRRHNFDMNNPLFDQIDEYLEKPIPMNWNLFNRDERKSFIRGTYPDRFTPDQLGPRMQVCCAELLTECLDMRFDGPNYRSMSREVTAYMDKMQPGWERVLTVNDKVYGRQKGWRRIATDQDDEEEII